MRPYRDFFISLRKIDSEIAFTKLPQMRINVIKNRHWNLLLKYEIFFTWCFYNHLNLFYIRWADLKENIFANFSKFRRAGDDKILRRFSLFICHNFGVHFSEKKDWKKWIETYLDGKFPNGWIRVIETPVTVV